MLYLHESWALVLCIGYMLQCSCMWWQVESAAGMGHGVGIPLLS